jgi:pimeloyl-ACP methyl ester carboxylesterase
VVSVGGIASLKDWEREIRLVCGDETVSRLAPGDGPERFADTSPDLLLPLGVPLVLLHGVYDAVAYPAMGLRFAQAARAAGDRAEVQPAPVAGHFEPIAPGTPAFAQALAAVEAFARLPGQITPSR